MATLYCAYLSLATAIMNQKMFPLLIPGLAEWLRKYSVAQELKCDKNLSDAGSTQLSVKCRLVKLHILFHPIPTSLIRQVNVINDVVLPVARLLQERKWHYHSAQHYKRLPACLHKT